MEFYTEYQLVSPANAGFCFDFGLITAGRLLHIGEAKENKILSQLQSFITGIFPITLKSKPV